MAWGEEGGEVRAEGARIAGWWCCVGGGFVEFSCVVVCVVAVVRVESVMW